MVYGMIEPAEGGRRNVNLEEFAITQGGEFLAFIVLVGLAVLFFNAIVPKR